MPSLYIIAVAALVVLIAVSLAACLREERAAERRSAAPAPAALPQPAAPLPAVRTPSSVVPFPARLERQARTESDLASLAAQLQHQAAALQAEGEGLREEIRQLRLALAEVAAARSAAAHQTALVQPRMARAG